MSRRSPFHRQIFEHLRGVGQDLPGGEVVERGMELGAEAFARGIDAVTDKVGGPARVRVVALLASVLALSAADTGAIAAIAPKLETSLHIGNVQIGLLVTVSALAAATGMLPIGWATDRVPRARMVTAAIILWGVAEVVSALAPGYAFLLIVRIALGALTAVTGPTLTSLIGDLFPARERSEIYGYILTGELIGAGFGLLVAGLVSSAFGWRVALAVLAIPSLLLAWQFHLRLPEPARGGQSRLERGAQQIVAAIDVEVEESEADGTVTASDVEIAVRDVENTASEPEGNVAAGAGGGPSPGRAGRFGARVRDPGAWDADASGVDAHEGVVLDRDPLDLGWWEAFHYVIAVRSNLTLIVGSALGYFFFGGVETFALIYLEGHYGIGQAPATLIALAVGGAAIAGAITGGRVTDRFLAKGHLQARFIIPAAAFLLAIVVFAPGAVSTTLVVAIPLFLVTGFCIGAPNPGLDAARLDVMPSLMWGRGEAVRGFLRSILQAFAPLVFGLFSTIFGGRNVGFGVSETGTHARDAAAHAAGLEQTFLIMLVTLFAAAVIVWWGRTYYPIDVAAATETERKFPPLQDRSERPAPMGDPLGGRPT